jgi:hypothetical protein
MGAVRVDAPLEHVALVAQRPGHLPVSAPLLARADVEHHRARSLGLARLDGREALEAVAGLGEQASTVVRTKVQAATRAVQSKR